MSQGPNHPETLKVEQLFFRLSIHFTFSQTENLGYCWAYFDAVLGLLDVDLYFHHIEFSK